YGVSDELKKRANHKISMSEFTFTHDMAQLILLEQLYRGYTVLNKIPYHH
ncbi:MAG: 23S rRNA (pseudouridine(1915)-N(3))-methyltransferase RlmH, partial [Bacteroidia bacterium]|nr:23S rRNA (pseudouridine(1915)-N(3))-methyltransferase RlmH [Bacteroidia bacterium]NNM15283.1 23S rRNA (pseudouridine(1915)-N(3))-methyltransferase RlmH [Bacteroidia bacterium]